MPHSQRSIRRLPRTDTRKRHPSHLETEVCWQKVAPESDGCRTKVRRMAIEGTIRCLVQERFVPARAALLSVSHVRIIIHPWRLSVSMKGLRSSRIGVPAACFLHRPRDPLPSLRSVWLPFKQHVLFPFSVREFHRPQGIRLSVFPPQLLGSVPI